MKYFTLQWWNDCQQLGSYTDEITRPIQQHRLYFESVREQLPAELIAFENRFTLHDAGFLNLEIDVEEQEAHLSLLLSVREENQPIRDQKATLHYAGLKSFGSSEDSQYSLVGPGGHGDLGYDEVKIVSDNLFEHRMLFSSGIEFVIRFRDFRFTIEP